MGKAKEQFNQSTGPEYQSYWAGAINGESIGAKAERKQIVAGIRARIEHEGKCDVCAELRLMIDEIERRGETVKHTQIVTSLEQQSDDKVTPAAGAWPPPLDSEPTAFYNITESRNGKGSTLFGR